MYWCTLLGLTICWIKLVISRKWLEGDIRLVGGPRKFMGTVVFLHNGKWGAVCDDRWDMKDASVVCRQLGYTLALRATTQSEFGPGRRKIWLSQVHCTGQEDRLDKCSFEIYDENAHKCSARNRSAGVICSAGLPTTMKVRGSGSETVKNEKTTSKRMEDTAIKITAKNITSRIVQDTNSMETRATSGKLLATRKLPQTAKQTVVTPNSVLMLETTVGTVRNTTVDSKLVVSTVAPVDVKLEISTDLLVKHDSSPLSMAIQDSVGYPESVDTLLYQEMTTHDTGRAKMPAAGNSSSPEGDIHQLICNATDKGSNKERCEDFFADDPLVENLEIRLQGGRYKWEGHLQVRLNGGDWGAICSDYWTLREAMVACNQLSEYGKAKQALMTSYFGGVDLPKTVYRMQCVGRESTFASCNITLSDKTHVCSKNTAIAGAVCSQHLPDLVPNLRAVEDSVRLQDQPLYYLRCAMEENCLASSAYVIKNTSLTWRNNMRRLLRFSTVVHNRGLADFRPYRPRGQWEWHACHMHYHSMEIFAHYDILDAQGVRLAEGSKASFCLEDTTCDNGVHPQYNCRGFADQGLSVNCSDNYMYDIDCQWIDISDIKPGEYTFLMEVNPTMLVAESNFDNNIVSCRMYYSGYFVSVRNCHYESLLDYREEIVVLK